MKQNKSFINIHGGSSREKHYWNETPTFLTDKLIQVSEKGLAPFSSDLNNITDLHIVGDTLEFPILANYDIIIEDIDTVKGLILCKYPPPSDLKLSYEVNDAWSKF